MKKSIYLHLRRSKLKSNSIETYFTDISENVTTADFGIKLVTAPLQSRGILRRFLLLFYILGFRGKLNHIAGDFHFLSLALIRKKYILSIMDLVFDKKLVFS